MFNQTLQLKDRLFHAVTLLQDCKLVGKEKPFELRLAQQKLQPGILDKLDSNRFQLLLVFIQDVFNQHIQPKLISPDQNPNFFIDIPNRNDCMLYLTLVTVVCYSKLINSMPQTQDTQLDQKTQTLKLTSFLLSNILTESAQQNQFKVPGPVIDVALHFTKLSAEEIVNYVNKTKPQQQVDLLDDYFTQNQNQRGFMETLVLAALSLFVCLNKDLEKDQIVTPLVKTLEQLFSLFEKMHSVFYVQQHDFSNNSLCLQSFLFREFLVEVHTGTYYTQSSLLNVALIVSHKFLKKIGISKNRKGYGPALIEIIDQLDQIILKSVDKVFRRQIRYYQITEKYFKIQKDENSTNEETFQLNEKQPIFDCRKVVLDPEMVLSSISDLNQNQHPTKFYLSLKEEQENWLRVNQSLYEISLDIMPRYFLKKDNILKLQQTDSYISHMCDLMRIQIYFIMRFDQYQPYLAKFVKRLSVIPEHMGYDCQLVLTLQRMFNSMFYENINPDYNKEILRQIFKTFDMICQGFYDQADKLNYLKVHFLLFMNAKLQGIDVCNVLSSDQQLISALFNLFKIEFYSEKYVQIFEEMFDLGSVPDILTLQEIVSKLDSKKSDDETNKQEGVLFINKVIVQQQSIQLIIQTAARSENFYKIAVQMTINEINKEGMNKCDPNGTVYYEHSQIFMFANTQQQISLLEYKLPQAGAFNCQLYQCLKLQLGLISHHLAIESPQSKIYDILHYSENHQQQQQHSQGEECDDCLRKTFKKVQLHKAFQAESLTPLFVTLLQRIKLLSATLDKQEKFQMSIFTADNLDQLMTMEKNTIKQRLNQQQVLLSERFKTSNQRIENSPIGYKIVEKVNTMMMRFLVFCSQSQDLSSSLVEAITGKKPNDFSVQSQEIEIQRVSATKQIQTTSIQQLNQTVMNISNIEFRLLILRNILFQIDTKLELFQTFTENLIQTFSQIDDKLRKEVKIRSEKFNKLMLKIDPSYNPNVVKQIRDRVVSNNLLTQNDYFLQNQRFLYKKYAEIAITVLTQYVSIICKGQDNIRLFENLNFQTVVLKSIQCYVLLEQSYISEFITAVLQLFLFRAKENTNPLKFVKANQQVSLQFVCDQNNQNKLSDHNQKYLECLFSTIVDYIRIVCPDPDLFNKTKINEDELIKLLQSIKTVFERFNEYIAVREGNTVHEKLTADLIKLQKSITDKTIQYFKKIYIFLYEQHNRKVQGVDVNYIIKQFNQIITRIFSILPKTPQIKEFFSFFREITYYNQQIDEVDVSLLENVLQIFNQSLNLRNRARLSSGIKSSKWNDQKDHFVFSQITPGLLILNSIECQKELQIIMMFKFSHESLIQSQSNSQKTVSMVVMSIQDRSDETTAILQGEQRINIDIELVIDLQTRNFVVKDPKIDIKSCSPEKVSLPFKPISIQNKWYTLIIRLNRFNKGILGPSNFVGAEVSIDKFGPENRVFLGEFKSDQRAKFHLALGNTVDYCADQKPPSNRYFKGRCSIPVFGQGLPDYRSTDQDLQKAIIMQLQDQISQKQVVNIRKLEIKTIFESKPDKKSRFVEFISNNHYTNQALIAHQVLNKIGFICAVHHRNFSEVTVCTNGFKIMYPIITRIVNSNILELGRHQPGHILSIVFRILSSYINLEPAHIEELMQRKNLIQILKYWIIEIGTHQMITTEFFQEVKNILKINIYAQIGIPNGQQNTFSVFQNYPPSITSYAPFYQEFLKEFLHQILLDNNILQLTCYIIPKVIHDRSTTNSTVSDHKQSLVFNEVVELIHHICCPKNIDQLQNQQIDNLDSDVITDPTSNSLQDQSIYLTDYNLLRSTVVQKETIEKLLELVDRAPFNQIQNLSLLNQIGEAISASILYLDEKECFYNIIKRTINEFKQNNKEPALAKETLLVFLKIILKIIASEDYKSKQGLISVQNRSKDFFSIEKFAQILYQFERQPFKDYSSDEGQFSIQDQIISVTLLILMQMYINNRSQYTKQKQQQEKLQELLNTIRENLSKNYILKTETYVTLMSFTISKKLDKIPSIDNITSLIQYCSFASQNRSDLNDFDIDFFFLVLENLQKYSNETKVLFINNYIIFLRLHQSKFMKVFYTQSQELIRNPFDIRLKEFYFKIVDLLAESDGKDTTMFTQTQELLIDVCFHQFIRSQDEFQSQQLTEQDEWGIGLFKRIFLFLEFNIPIQLTLLQRVIRKIVDDMNTRGKSYAQPEQIKINCKLIYLVQFIEEWYIKMRKQLSLFPQFLETLQVIMFLFEQLGILTFDLPDRVSYDLDNDNEKKKTQKLIKNRNKSVKQNKQTPLVFQKQADLLMSVEEGVLNNLSQQQINDDFEGQWHLVGQKVRPSKNYISGGPARIFMHILLNQLILQANTVMFSNVLEMLRLLMFRKRGPFFMRTILQVFGNHVDTQNVKVYTLFNRPMYMKEIRSQKRQNNAVKPTDTLNKNDECKCKVKMAGACTCKINTRQENLLQPIHEYVKTELKIFKITTEGIFNTVNRRNAEETQDQQIGSQVPSYKDLKIAQNSMDSLEVYQKIGFTALNGFLMIQMISETIEIMNQIINSCSDKEIIQEDNEFFDTIKIAQLLSSEQKTKNIILLLTFLHECMKEEFSNNIKKVQKNDEQMFQKIQQYKIFPMIIDKLAENRSQESNEVKQSVRFWSQFLDQQFKEYSIELSQEYFQNSPQTYQGYSELPNISTPQSNFFNQKTHSNTAMKLKEESKFETLPLKKQITMQSQKEFQIEPIQIPKLAKTQSQHEKDEQQDENLHFPGLDRLKEQSEQSELFESEEGQNDDRQSWVESVQSPITPKTKQINASSRSSWQSKVSNGISDDLIAQYSKQISQYISKLFITLGQLVDSALMVEEQIEIVTKIIKQTLCKEKQRKIYISFALSTSHNYAYELAQVKLNSETCFAILKQEQDKFNSQDDLNERRNAFGNILKTSQYQSRTLMQSQQIFRPDRLEPANFRDADMRISENIVTKLPNMLVNEINMITQQRLQEMKYTMEYQYTKYFFGKIVKRLYEEESSIWYDHCEELQAEFKEIKELYDAMQILVAEDDSIDTAQKRQKIARAQFGSLDLEDKSIKVSEIENQLSWSYLIENPKQRNCFVSQRRNIDMWGRMMLIKPNRKALDYNHWLYYDYFVFDFLNKLFAVSLLNDDDFQDLVKPLAQKSGVSTEKIVKLIQKQNQQLSSIQEEVNKDSESLGSNEEVSEQEVKRQEEQPLTYSVFVQKKRLELLHKMDKNKLLHRVFMDDKKPLKGNLGEEGKLKYFQENQDLIEKRKNKIFQIFKNEKEIDANNKDVRLYEAQCVTLQGNYWGYIMISRNYFYFYSICAKTPNVNERPDLMFIDSENAQKIDKKVLILLWENIDEIMKRKLLNIFQGVDITTFQKKIYTFNLCSENKVDEFISVLQQFMKAKKQDDPYRIITDPRTQFIISTTPEYQFLTDWKNGQKSNMEFLLLMNKYAGRTFNHTGQYPFFPWVFNDYKSQGFQFIEKMKKGECFRDFNAHVGIMSDDKIAKSKKNLQESIEEPHLFCDRYGEGDFCIITGYQTSLQTEMYLTRLEPFTSISFISSDLTKDPRVPVDLKKTWWNFQNNISFNAELVPEYFYLPEVFMNLNKISLGKVVQEKDPKPHCQLDLMMIPPWAFNQYDFVRMMREGLESKHVSKSIGTWIDMVFGVLQKSKEHLNIFVPCSYEEFWTKEKLKTPKEVEKLNLKQGTYCTYAHKNQINMNYVTPSKLFDQPVIHSTAAIKDEKLDKMGNKVEEQKQNFNQLIKAFVENQQPKNKKKLSLGQISVHNYLDHQTNIVHMMFNNEKKCLVFIRQENTDDPRPDQGNLVVYLCQETLSKESFNQKPFDLQLRYEWVAENLNNVFQIHTMQGNKLYVCGYLDNQIRIFDLDVKAGMISSRNLICHNARVTCIKFTADFRYLYSCDSDGVILHFKQQSKKQQKNESDLFPYKILYKLQDQMDEILAIDTNQTLDLYVTLSRDGTIAVRCQRTSKLWYHFKIYSKFQKGPNNKEYIYQTFSRIFNHVISIKLSLHGYIVVVGQPDQQRQSAKYLVFNLSGDVLLRDHQERCVIKGVFLNATEDQLIIAMNYQENQKDKVTTQGNVKVAKLYGLEKLANLSQLVYQDALQQIQMQKQVHPDYQKNAAKKDNQINTPTIQAIAMKKGEASLNIFFENQESQPPTKEIICFETSKLPVWTQLEDMALAPRTRAE